MGGVMVYEPDDDSDVEGLPWAVTFEASAGEEWASFVCGPYQRDEAVALAEEVVTDGVGVSAVVEPLLPVRSAVDVLSTIAELREDVEDPT